MVPVTAFGSAADIQWSSVYRFFRQWVKDGSWKRAYQAIVKQMRHLLDLSLAHFDDTHSLVYRGGSQQAYQRRRRHKTSNTLWLADRNGLVVSYIPPEAGNHNDMYELIPKMGKFFEDLKCLNINFEGLFINADAGFDYPALRDHLQLQGAFLNAPLVRRANKDMCAYDYYCDEQAYKERFVIERTNAWMDAYRSLMHRFDTTVESWGAWHDIYCIVTWLRKAGKP